MPNQPNILFILSDQHNARCLSGAGHPDVQTPHLDALAARGVRFTHAFAQNPICTPSRMCFLTGLYAHNHGYYGLMGPPPSPRPGPFRAGTEARPYGAGGGGLPSMFSHFRAHGYHTGVVGKIHTPVPWIEEHADYARDAYGHGVKPSDFAAYLRNLNPPRLEDRDDEVLQEWRALGRGGQGLDARPSRLPLEHSVERWCAYEAENFLRQRPADRPFLLWLSPPRPHETYLPSQEFWDRYDEETLTLPPNADDDLLDKPPHVQAMRGQRRDGHPMWLFEPKTYEAGRRRVLRGYLGCVTQVDESVGYVLNVLQELGLTDNTIILYTADHGDFAGEHGIIEKAPGVGFDAITRIPFLWSWPGHIPTGGVCGELVESVDVLPTLCALAGLPPVAMCDGHDLSPLLYGGRTPLREAAFTENPYSRVIRTKEWKLVHTPRAMYPDATTPSYEGGAGGGEVGELYDLVHDPWELENLYGRPEHADRVEALRRQLLDWLITSEHPVTVHPMPVRATPDGEAAGDEIVEDGRLAPAQVRELVRKGQRNYL